MRPLSRSRHPVALSLAAVALITAACGRSDSPPAAVDSISVIYAALGDAAADIEGNTILEVPDGLFAGEGFLCGNYPRGFSGLATPIDAYVPGWVNRMSIVHNGFRLTYDNGDHHVKGVGSIIEALGISPGNEFEPTRILWGVTGRLEDDEPDEPYESCHSFLLLGWRDEFIDIKRHDQDNSFIRGSRVSGSTDTGARVVIEDEVRSVDLESDFPDFEQGDAVALLPRGFSVGFAGGDRHLLQQAFRLIQHGDLASPGEPIRLRAHAILKDNEAQPALEASARIAVIGGTGVQIEPTSMTISPKLRGGVQCAGGIATRTRRFKKSATGVDLLLPVLTGWELHYPCDDEHIAQLGVWIHDVRWDGERGELQYSVTSTQQDRDARPGHHGRYGISFLGLQRRNPLEFDIDPPDEIASQ